MDRFFGADGPLINFLMKFGQLTMLTVVWMICCIPVITIGSATSSFYYSVMKSVRKEVGYPLREFFRSFKRTWKSGTFFTLCLVAWIYLLFANMRYLGDQSGGGSYFMSVVYYLFVFITAAFICYLFPVISRFEVSKKKLVKMTLVMVFLQLPTTVVLVTVPFGLVWLMIEYLPVPCILFVPGVWCFLSTFLIEPALRKFMPVPEEGEKEWYDE